jgi:hypothetical protein
LIAAIDNTFLTLLLNPGSAARMNPATGQHTSFCKERIETLIDEMSARGDTLLIPAPALAEALCVSAAAEAYFETLQQFASIEIAPFDGKAAIELGRIIRKAKEAGDKRSGQTGDWQHVKMDRAIVAIAVARSANIFYSDDKNQIAFANSVGMTVKSTWDLNLSDSYAQRDLSENAEEPWPAQRRTPKSNGLGKRRGP